MKKRGLIFGMMLIFLLPLLSITQVFGAGNENQYKSNGEVSFYGEYIYPTEPDKEIPTPNENGISNLPDTESKPQHKLPQAGDQFEGVNLLIGISMIGLAGQVFYYLTKKNKKIFGGKNHYEIN